MGTVHNTYVRIIGRGAKDKRNADRAGVAGVFCNYLPESGIDVAFLKYCGGRTERKAEEGNGGGSGEMHLDYSDRDRLVWYFGMAMVMLNPKINEVWETKLHIYRVSMNIRCDGGGHGQKRKTSPDTRHQVSAVATTIRNLRDVLGPRSGLGM